MLQEDVSDHQIHCGRLLNRVKVEHEDALRHLRNELHESVLSMRFSAWLHHHSALCNSVSRGCCLAWRLIKHTAHQSEAAHANVSTDASKEKIYIRLKIKKIRVALVIFSKWFIRLRAAEDPESSLRTAGEHDLDQTSCHALEETGELWGNSHWYAMTSALNPEAVRRHQHSFSWKFC